MLTVKPHDSIPQGACKMFFDAAIDAQAAVLDSARPECNPGVVPLTAVQAAMNYASLDIPQDMGDGSTGNADPSKAPGSTPGMAADREAGTQPTRPVQGGTTIVIQGDIKANGAIDQDFTENLARELDRLKSSREV